MFCDEITRYITQNTKCSISCNKYTILNAKDTNNAILIKKYTNKIPSTPFQIISSWWQEQRIEEELSGWAIDWSFDRLSRVQKVWTLAVYQFWQLLEALPCLSWCHQLADCCIHQHQTNFDSCKKQACKLGRCDSSYIQKAEVLEVRTPQIISYFSKVIVWERKNYQIFSVEFCQEEQ